MKEPLKFIQFGMGPIGVKIADYLLERDNVQLDAAIDIDPAKAGVDAGTLMGREKPLGVSISANAEETLASSDADVVVLSTLSSFAKLEEQIRLCIKHRKNVISSCEEMAYPWDENSDLAQSIDDAAKSAGVTILSNGVNPGFAMDALPVFLTSVSRRVDSIHIARHQNAALRRLPFQQKIGAGLPLDDFREKVKAKSIRHVGFTESIQMIAKAMGWKLDRVEDIVEPAIAESDLESQFIKVVKGDAAGVLQTATGYMNGKPVINIELQAYLGHPEPKDSVQIEGEPQIYSEVKGGFHGDIATCAMVANSVPAVRRAEPGLKTMIDIGLTSWFKGHG
ncbi:MAG: dihydrodipicolinate reductase [Desulfuromonas sp.]|nr:MAG: dihydrodipicolinate reductase [Desulfuromonas sp.]